MASDCGGSYLGPFFRIAMVYVRVFVSDSRMYSSEISGRLSISEVFCCMACLLHRTLRQSDQVALRVREIGKCQSIPRHLCRRNNRGSSELLRLFEIRGRILDLHVEADMTAVAILRGANAAGNAPVAGRYQAIAGTVAGILNLPIEQRTIELLEFRAVLAGDLE